MQNCIILRYGEIGLKSRRTRPYFEKKYVNSIAEALRRNELSDYKIKNLGGRFIIYTDNENNLEKTITILQKVPGIQSLSPAKSFTYTTKENLIEQIKPLLSEKIKDKTFCIKVKRVGTHPFSSLDISKEVAESVYELSKGVEFKTPDLCVSLEIRDSDCFFYIEKKDGTGGLPPATSGKVLCLFSGGIDSPVAAYQIIKRGCMADFLFINLRGEKSFQDVAKVYNHLINDYAYNYIPRFYIVDGNKIIEKIKTETNDRYRQIAIKIAFYKIAEAVANANQHLAIITGEALAQKSSQTLESLNLINSQITLPVLRPLIGMDKKEIIELARKINTLNLSEDVQEYCNLSAGPVITTPDRSILSKIPSLNKLITEAVKDTIEHKGTLKIEEIPTTTIEQFKLLPNLITIDIRPESVQENSPIKTNLSKPFPEILTELDHFRGDNNYILICDLGIKSSDIAYLLKKRKINAIGLSVKDFLKYFSN